MTAIRINPETLEQDGTVALPGENLQWQKFGIVCCLYVMYYQASRRETEILRSQIDCFMTLLHFRPASVFHLKALHLTPVPGRILQHFRICEDINLKTTRG